MSSEKTVSVSLLMRSPICVKQVQYELNNVWSNGACSTCVVGGSLQNAVAGEVLLSLVTVMSWVRDKALRLYVPLACHVDVILLLVFRLRSRGA